jgi:hypothetical protein
VTSRLAGGVPLGVAAGSVTVVPGRGTVPGVPLGRPGGNGMADGGEAPARHLASGCAAGAGQTCGWPMLTIQEIPNWSSQAPNSSPHICFSRGTDTVPEADSFVQ